MSGRFVRQSLFRHVHGVAAKPQDQYSQLSVMCNGDSQHIAGNNKFFCFSTRGGGGPVVVIPHSKTGRVPMNTPKVAVHRAKVLDYAFNPFLDNMLATCGEDCMTKIVTIPDGGLTSPITEALCTLEGHERKVTSLKFNPIANNLLATASADHTVKVWDIEAQSEVLTRDDFKDAIFSHEWNRNGSEMAVLGKDRLLRVYDPRSQGAVSEVATFQGSKKASVFWASKVGLIGAIGFTRSSTRQLMFFDPKNMSAPLHTMDIDQSAGVFMPYYDHDTSILYLTGKGDSSVKYYEITSEKPHCFFLDEFRDSSSQKGVCWLPKSGRDVKSCEIAKCMRLLRDKVVPVSFQVPRKSDLFQKDLFPDTYLPEPQLESKAWLEGKNAEVALVSMKPGQAGERKQVAFKKKKSPAELQAELDAANARIKALEAELAALKA